MWSTFALLHILFLLFTFVAGFCILLVTLTLLLATSCTPRAAAEEFKFSFNPVKYSEPATGFQLKAK